MAEEIFTSVVDVAFSYSYALKGSSFWHTKGDCSSHVLLVVTSNKEMVFSFIFFSFNFWAMTENTVNWNQFAMNRFPVFHSPVLIEQVFSSLFSLLSCPVSLSLSLSLSLSIYLSLSIFISIHPSIHHTYLPTYLPTYLKELLRLAGRELRFPKERKDILMLASSQVGAPMD